MFPMLGITFTVLGPNRLIMIVLPLLTLLIIGYTTTTAPDGNPFVSTRITQAVDGITPEPTMVTNRSSIIM